MNPVIKSCLCELFSKKDDLLYDCSMQHPVIMSCAHNLSAHVTSLSVSHNLVSCVLRVKLNSLIKVHSHSVYLYLYSYIDYLADLIWLFFVTEVSSWLDLLLSWYTEWWQLIFSDLWLYTSSLSWALPKVSNTKSLCPFSNKNFMIWLMWPRHVLLWRNDNLLLFCHGLWSMYAFCALSHTFEKLFRVIQVPSSL